LGSLWNTLFWLSIGLAATLALHAAIRALIIWRGWRMRMIFEVREVLLLMRQLPGCCGGCLAACIEGVGSHVATLPASPPVPLVPAVAPPGALVHVVCATHHCGPGST
jgi:hypothetical protein